jgi:alpha-mannosidase
VAGLPADPAVAGTLGTVSRGPVVSEFTVRHGFGAKGIFSSRIRLYAGLPRIDIRTTIVNQDQFVRYRVLFPTSIPTGQSTHEIPFGAIDRPEGIEFPAQNWADYSDSSHGLAVLNRGLPGNNVADGTMMLSLLRSTCIVAYGFFGGYEQGVSSDTGFELGKELTFDYALLPHAGDWREAQVYRHGLEFNHPLLARPAAAHAGILPGQWGLLRINRPNVVVSALKSGPDGSAILRLYEAAGQPAPATRIEFSAPAASAEEVNLMEDPGQKVAVARDGGAVQLDLRPFEIKTVRVLFKQ